MWRAMMGAVLEWLHGAVERMREFAYAEPPRRPRVGLALGGGFARGIAHVGVLKVLQENQIPIDYIAGTSAGALVGMAYASNAPIAEIARQAAATRFHNFARWKLSWMGLATNERLESYPRHYLGVERFEELRTPLAIAATDLTTGEPVYFTAGLLGPALRASCAYPGLFVPIKHDGRLLVDGFLTAPVPVEAVRKMGADVVIAVYLEAMGFEKSESVADVISRSFSIIQRCAHQDWRKQADVIIEPHVKNYVWDDFKKAAELITAGEAAARAALPAIRAALVPPPVVQSPEKSAAS